MKLSHLIRQKELCNYLNYFIGDLKMNLEVIYELAPWEWPEEADEIFYDVLNDPRII